MNSNHPFDPGCIFCQIIAGQKPARVRYESEHVFAFDDIHPKAATHVLICPRAHYPTFLETPDSVLAILGQEIKSVAAQIGLSHHGFRLVVNNGPASGQIVFHLHYHMLAGARLGGF
ncbi:MAG: HIT domain-containing protein [Candidatus Zixiibacteriota bacterium]